MILPLVFGQTRTQGQLLKEFKVLTAAMLTRWERKGYIQCMRANRRVLYYSRDEVVRMMAFGVDWAGRKRELTTPDARDMVAAIRAYPPEVDSVGEWEL
jgi:transposase